MKFTLPVAFQGIFDFPGYGLGRFKDLIPL